MTIAFAGGETPAKNTLSFAVSDAIRTPDGSALFLLSKGEKKVYKLTPQICKSCRIVQNVFRECIPGKASLNKILYNCEPL